MSGPCASIEIRSPAGSAFTRSFQSRTKQARQSASSLRRSIESDRQNFTRFFLLRTAAYARRHRAAVKANTPWKTSLVFSLHNQAGALFRALSAFALRDLSLTKIESRPLRGKPWEYLFYVDFLGHLDSPQVRNALGHLRELADFQRVLGCYPKGA